MKHELNEAPGSKQLRVSMLVWNYLQQCAAPFETPDCVLRRALGLPARNKGVKSESGKSGPRKTKKAA